MPIRPGTDAYLLIAMVQVIAERGPRRRSARREDLVTGLDEVVALARAVHPEAVGRATGHRRPTTSAALARELAAAPTRLRLRPHRHHHRRVRHDRRLAGRRAQRPHRQPRPPRRRDVHHGRRRRQPTRAARPASAAASASTGARSRVRGLPETLGELPGRGAGRGDRHARRGPDPGAGHHRRQPRAVHAQLGTGSTPPSPALEFMVSVDIYLNETTRHADVILPAPSPLQKGHYDLALLQLALRNVANYSRARAAARRRPARRVGGARPPGARCSRALGADADPAVVDDLMVDVDGAGERGRRDEPDPRARRRRDPRRRWRRGAAPSASSTSCCAPAPTATGFGADPDGLSLDRLLANPHGVDLGAARAPPPGGAAHARRDDRAGARSSLVADVARLADGPRRPPRAPVRARRPPRTCARTTRGCTTSRCW